MRYVRIEFNVNYFSEEEPRFHIFGFKLNHSDEFIDDVKNKANEEGISDNLFDDFENMVGACFDYATIGHEEVFGGGVYELDETHVDHFQKCMEFLRDWFETSSCRPGEIIHTFGPYDSALAEFETKL